MQGRWEAKLSMILSESTRMTFVGWEEMQAGLSRATEPQWREKDGTFPLLNLDLLDQQNNDMWTGEMRQL